MTGLLLHELESILGALLAGLVPQKGLRHIQTGRDGEVLTILNDLAHVVQGGSRVRFVMGEQGAGKTFFLNLARELALRKRFVVTYASLVQDLPLVSSSGPTRALTFDLMRNLATRSKPGGGGLSGIVERFISDAAGGGRSRGVPVEAVLYERLDGIEEMPGGSDFIQAIIAYWRGHKQDNEQLQADALRWLRAGFTSNAEAERALGIRSMSSNVAIGEYLALWGRFALNVGFSGFMVCFDNLVNLFNLPDPEARRSNYEEILRMLANASLGNAQGLYALVSGTPEVFMDTRCGIFSSPQLRSYMMENRVALSDSFLQLRMLTSEDLFLFFCTIRDFFVKARVQTGVLPDEGVRAFMECCSFVLGERYYQRPRSAITNFVHLLLLLEKNPRVPWPRLVNSMKIEPDHMPHPLSLPVCH